MCVFVCVFVCLCVYVCVFAHVRGYLNSNNNTCRISLSVTSKCLRVVPPREIFSSSSPFLFFLFFLFLHSSPKSVGLLTSLIDDPSGGGWWSCGGCWWSCGGDWWLLSIPKRPLNNVEQSPSNSERSRGATPKDPSSTRLSTEEDTVMVGRRKESVECWRWQDMEKGRGCCRRAW